MALLHRSISVFDHLVLEQLSICPFDHKFNLQSRADRTFLAKPPKEGNHALQMRLQRHGRVPALKHDRFPLQQPVDVVAKRDATPRPLVHDQVHGLLVSLSHRTHLFRIKKERKKERKKAKKNVMQKLETKIESCGRKLKSSIDSRVSNREFPKPLPRAKATVQQRTRLLCVLDTTPPANLLLNSPRPFCVSFFRTTSTHVVQV